MGLLGQGWDDPQSAGIMALASGLLQGNFGGGLLAANNAIADSKQNSMKQKLMSAQIAETLAQADERKSKLAMAQQAQADRSRYLNGDPNGVSPGAFSPSLGGVGPVMPPGAAPVRGGLIEEARRLGIPEHAIQSDVVFNDGKGISDMLFKRGTPNIEYVNGVAVDKNRAQAGSSLPQMQPNGQASQIVPDPAAPGGYRIITPEGALEAYRSFKKADADIASSNELVKVVGQDGAERWVPKTQVLGRPAPQPPVTTPPRAGQRTSMVQPGDADRQMIWETELQQAHGRLAAAKTPEEQQRATNDIAGLQREMQRAGLSPTAPMQASPTTAQRASAKGAEVTAEQTAKDVAETRKGIMGAGFTAGSNIAKYQQIGKLLQDVDGGALTATGTHLASLANSLGLKIDKNLPNKEAAASLANEAALQLRNPSGGAGMPGAMSDADRNFLASMTPNMTQSAQGRKIVIDSYVAVQQRNQQVATFARKWEQKHGSLNNDFFDQMQAWSASNPLFKAK